MVVVLMVMVGCGSAGSRQLVNFSKQEKQQLFLFMYTVSAVCGVVSLLMPVVVMMVNLCAISILADIFAE